MKATTERVQVLTAQWCGGQHLDQGAATTKALERDAADLLLHALAPLMAEKAEDRPFQLAATIHPAMMTWMQTCMHLDNVFGVSPLNMTAGIFLEEDPREERTRRTRAPAVWNSRMALHRRDRHGIRRLGSKGAGVQRDVLSRMPNSNGHTSRTTGRKQGTTYLLGSKA